MPDRSGTAVEPPSKVDPRDPLGAFLDSVRVVKDQRDAEVLRETQSAGVVSGAEAPRDAQSGEVAPSSEAGGTPPSAQATLSAALSLLAAAHEAHEDPSIADVAEMLAISTLETADLIKRLLAGGLVIVDGEPGHEVVRLTEEGKALVGAA